jgi:hypothetical protein
VTTGAVLGDVKPFQHFVPAHVLPGLRSVNGSDYTSLTIRQWVQGSLALNASVKIETAAVTNDGSACNGTIGAGGVRCDLLVSACCDGPDCQRIAVAAYADYQWDRAGSLPAKVTPSSGETVAVSASPAGFPDVLIYGVAGANVSVSSLNGIAGDSIVASFGCVVAHS